MQEFLKWLEGAIASVNEVLANYILVVLLIGVGLFFTIKTKFVQVRYFKQGIKNVFGKRSKGDKKRSGISSFQAFTTAVAAQVGTGNIVGASSAILVGGPGAIFWMWVIAFLGMATIYAEAVLAQRTRVVNLDGSVSGGPIYYIRTAFKGKFGKFLAGFFAVAVIISLGFVGTMVQSNAISSAIANAGGYDYTQWGWIVGIIVGTVSLFIFLGGAKRVATITEKLVPIMAIIYLLGGLVILCINIAVLPEAFALIFSYAFTPQAIIGGGIGAALKKALSMGAKRGLFSNEAGMGSTPHAHAQAEVKTAHEQGTVAMISVFIDTFIVITMTALMVITSLYAGNGPIMQISQTAINSGKDAFDAVKNAGYVDASLVATAISTIFASADVGSIIGAVFVAICLTFFAFSTIISWNLFGRINFEYLFGKKSVIIYILIAVLFVLLGSMLSSGLVWNFSDFFNYLMVLPNAIALIKLSKTVVSELKTNGKKSAVETPNVPLSDNVQ